ncbi:MFS transporter [Dyadobacter sediminis]|uniref:MFS transporter n=1 Tax=Dyadobacter sediminis TaxID=1493691 RepID=A0A5R9KJM3_9BACT|nr:MFS transporter [Dyadobacter sediminis]TLU96417.1 MFS transporter [Dyadobacter sediminis]GGB82063.1 MFS transporter [Dyadobacter sediminis]
MNIPALSAFDSRNYKLYFAGQTISLLGTWMQKTAVSWIIYSMTHSKFMLGVSIFANLFPSAMLTPFGGVVSDRYNRYRVLLVTQVLSMLQALTLTLVVYFKNYAVWEIISLSVVLGLINAFDVPARQSLVYELVDDKKNLPNALALNSSMVNLSKLIGPAIAGIAIERFGEVVCFGANAFSFIAVISSLLMIRLPAFQAVKHTKNIFGELAEGLTYIRQTPSIRYIIVMLALVSLLLLPFTSLMPIYAKDIFKGTASTFGLLDSAIGCGALVGAIFLATLQPGTNLSRILAINTFVFGTGLILFSYTSVYPLALVFIAVGAFGMMSQTTISNTLIQTTVAPAMRGRVISIFVMAYSGGVPIGSLLVSYVSQHIGVQATVMGQGILALIIGTMHVRYLKKNKASEQINATRNLNEEIAHA